MLGNRQLVLKLLLAQIRYKEWKSGARNGDRGKTSRTISVVPKVGTTAHLGVVVVHSLFFSALGCNCTRFSWDFVWWRCHKGTAATACLRTAALYGCMETANKWNIQITELGEKGYCLLFNQQQWSLLKPCKIWLWCAVRSWDIRTQYVFLEGRLLTDWLFFLKMKKAALLYSTVAAFLPRALL